MIGDLYDLAGFIADNYAWARKIAEPMVGKFPWLAAALRAIMPSAEILVTDIDPSAIEFARSSCPGLRAELDDLLSPRIELYEGVDLIYAIRPPPELIPYAAGLARRVGSDLLVRPHWGEEAGFDFERRMGWKFLTHRSARFFILRSPGICSSPER
ncbi:MAG: UPF0146 family protein [Candidatus Bathyarchaeia archaeon]